MIEPQNRSLLTDLLQPPTGYELHQAIGTTFTLDLAAALSVPLSFASRSHADEENLGILAALARYTDRIMIFSQAGEVRAGNASTAQSALVGLLEAVLHTVHPPRGIFHPKIWFLEFASGEHRKYRFLNLSRNLTGDRSWDLVVRLDGETSLDDEVEVSETKNAPMMQLLKRLPSLAVRTMREDQVATLEAFAERISRVMWEYPLGVRDVRFHVLDGRPQSERQPGEPDPVDRMLDFEARHALVISPFISDEGIRHVTERVSHQTRIVSRIESLDGLATVSPTTKYYVLDEATDGGEWDNDTDYLREIASHAELTGLHAKALFVQNRHKPSEARAYIGSANFTGGGLRNNIEVMVELRGHIRELGPQEVYESLQIMLEQYTPEPGVEEDTTEKIQRRFEYLLHHVAAQRMYARVHGDDPYSLSVWGEAGMTQTLAKLESEGAHIRWRLLSSKEWNEHLATEEPDALPLTGLRLTDITPFVEVSATATVEGQKIEATTLVLAELRDDIESRVNKVLAQQISDSDTFYKLLALLLDPAQFSPTRMSSRLTGDGGSWNQSSFTNGLFERLMTSLARGDDGLDVAHRFIKEIQHHAGDGFEPPGEFLELWDSVWQVRIAEQKRAGL